MGRWADRVSMAPGNVSRFATKEDGRAVVFGGDILVNRAGLQHLALDQSHVVSVNNGAAKIVHEGFQAADASLESHEILFVRAQGLVRGG